MKQSHTLPHRERKPPASVKSRSPSRHGSRDGDKDPLARSVADKYGPLVAYIGPEDYDTPEDRGMAVVHHRVVERIPPSSVRSPSPSSSSKGLIRPEKKDDKMKEYDEHKAKYEKHKAKAAPKKGGGNYFDKDGGVAALVLIGAAGYAASKLIYRNHEQIKNDRERSRSARREMTRSVSRESRRLSRERSREGRPHSDDTSPDSENVYHPEGDHVHHRGGRSPDREHDHHPDRGYESDSDTISLSSVDSAIDEVRLKSMKRRQQFMAGFASVAVANAGRKIYLGVDKRKARLAALEKGKISPAQEKKLKDKNRLNNAISMAVAGMAVRSAVLKYRESKGSEAEQAEYKKKREEFVRLKEEHEERKRRKRDMELC